MEPATSSSERVPAPGFAIAAADHWRVLDGGNRLVGRIDGGSGVGRIQVEALGGDFLVSGNTAGDAAAEFAFVVRTGLSGLRASDFLL